MNTRQRRTGQLLKQLLVPLLLYEILFAVITEVLTMAVPQLTEAQNAMWLLLAANLLMSPVFLWMYVKDSVPAPWAVKNTNPALKKIKPERKQQTQLTQQKELFASDELIDGNGLSVGDEQTDPESLTGEECLMNAYEQSAREEQTEKQIGGQKKGKSIPVCEEQPGVCAWLRNELQIDADALWIALGGILLACGWNILIGLTPLPTYFSGYEAATEGVYACSLISQILGSILVASFFEELVMRGLLYRRLRAGLSQSDDPKAGLRASLIWGAVLFGLFHGNLVQGIYAFLMGLFFVCVYEKKRGLWAPVLAHACANASSILLEATGLSGLLYATEAGQIFAMIVFLCLGGYCWRRFWS